MIRKSLQECFCKADEKAMSFSIKTMAISHKKHVFIHIL